MVPGHSTGTCRCLSLARCVAPGHIAGKSGRGAESIAPSRRAWDPRCLHMKTVITTALTLQSSVSTKLLIDEPKEVFSLSTFFSLLTLLQNHRDLLRRRRRIQLCRFLYTIPSEQLLRTILQLETAPSHHQVAWHRSIGLELRTSSTLASATVTFNPKSRRKQRLFSSSSTDFTPNPYIRPSLKLELPRCRQVPPVYSRSGT